MPLYEYKCSRGHQYEKTEGFDAPTEQACPHCGESAKRQISMPAIIFKGPGFYSTDNRKASYGGNGTASSAGKSEEQTPSPESGSDAKPDTKPDTKAETKTDTKTETKATD